MRWIIQSFGGSSLADREQRVARVERARRGARPRPCAAPTSGTRRCRGPRSCIVPAPYCPSGSRPRSRGTRADGPRLARRSGCRSGASGRPLRQRPGGEHAVALQPQVPVQPRALVLVDHEARRAAPRGAAPRWRRLGRAREVALGAVAPKARGGSRRRPACLRERTAPTASRRASRRRGSSRRRFFAAPAGFFAAASSGGRFLAAARRRRSRARTASRLAFRALIRSGAGARDLLGRRLHGDLLARRLALDQREHLLAVGVAVLLGLEVPGERVDQLPCDLELALWWS